MCYAHLTRAQRYQIEQLVQAKFAVSRIAKKLGVHRSTLYREFKRSGGLDQAYDAHRAQQGAERRARRSAANHPCKPARLWRRVRRLLRRDWSPEQARGYLLRFGQPTVSVPAIYAHVQRQRAQGKPLYEHLRFGHKRRRWGAHPHSLQRRSGWSIRERPAQVQLRLAPGHWEGDTLIGSNRIHRTLALVERHSRYLLLRHPERPYAPAIARSTICALRALPTQSITFDNGGEFSDYKTIARQLRCRVYFADPYKPWQRGTCENTIGLVRQYIPKGSSGRHLSAAQIQRIQDKLNHRPRKCLGYKTPAEVLLLAKPPVALRT